MKQFIQDLLTLDKPVMTESLAPKLAPFARVIYLVSMVFLACSTLGVLYVLLTGNLSAFLLGMIGIAAEFAIIRMFCEYLTSVNQK